MWIIAKITPAVNWPGLAYSAQQLLKTRGHSPHSFLCPCGMAFFIIMQH